MKIFMIFYDMQEFGGLEEYAAALAVGLQQQGNQVSVLSTAWVSPDNQYLRRLHENDVAFTQLPKWLSYPASDWPTKERLLSRLMRLLMPLVYLLAAGHFLVKRGAWQQSVISAHGWLRGQLSRFISPDWRQPLVRLLLNWWRFRWQPDLLHIQGYTSSLLFVIEWAHAQGIPVVYEEHQTPDAQFDWWADFQQSINKASRVVAVSEKSAEALRTVCGVNRPIVVRNPLLADPMASGWHRNGAEQQEDEALRITTVARLWVTKGLKYLLEAIVQVEARYPQSQFKVYGDGALRQELLAYAAELGLDGEQIFVGAFNHEALDDIMAQTDIFVMSSILEGQPLAVVEAMAYGCPIVTTAVGGIPELIQEGVNGLLCEPADPDCLAQKIITLIENPALRHKLGQAARTAYEQGAYQPASLSEYFSTLYQEVLQEKQALRVGLILYSLEAFGGLEEIATNLAVELKQQHHHVSILSTAWAPPDNQYLRRLRDNGVPFVQLPQWISHPASDWPTKEKLLTIAMGALTPLVYLLSSGLFLFRRRPWPQSRHSAYNWLRGQLMRRFIGPDWREPLVRLLLRWWRLRWRPDLLHIHGYTSSLLFVVEWAHRHKLPSVYVENQTPDTQFNWWEGFEQTINGANVVVAASEKSAEALQDVCGVTRPIVVFHPNVPDPVAEGWQMEDRPRPADEPLQVTTVARLWVTKGLTYLLDAIAQIKATHPHVHFKVYGEGALRPDLLAYADQLGLDGEAIFVGAFTDREALTQIMSQTDIFVMSSLLEGQPLALVEAMSYGCPIVTTTVGGIPELIQDGVNGLLCQPKDPDCLARQIGTLIEDPALRHRLGQAARKSYERGPFQPAAVSKHFVSVYQEVLQDRVAIAGLT